MIKFYSHWRKGKLNVFTPTLWYSTDGEIRGCGIDVFGFGFYIQW